MTTKARSGLLQRKGCARGSYHGADRIYARRRCHTRHDGRGETDRMDISDWRKKIDVLDEQIVQLINKRAEAAKAIGELKRETHLPVYEPGREQAVFDHVRAVNSGPLSDTDLVDIYQRLIDVMRTLQRRDGGQ